MPQVGELWQWTDKIERNSGQIFRVERHSVCDAAFYLIGLDCNLNEIGCGSNWSAITATTLRRWVDEGYIIPYEIQCQFCGSKEIQDEVCCNCGCETNT